MKSSTITVPANGILQLEKQFDASRLYEALSVGLLSQAIDINAHNQICLTHEPGNPDWFHGSGSLYLNDGKGPTWASTSQFKILHECFNGTYVEEVVEEVRAFAIKRLRGIGRVRILSLDPKTCYSLHTDGDEFRYHIPLITSHSAFFISNDLLGRMENPGQLYLFSTVAPHTAVNASLHNRRVHLVLDTHLERSFNKA